MLTGLLLVASFLVGMTAQGLQSGVVWQVSRSCPLQGQGRQTRFCLTCDAIQVQNSVTRAAHNYMRWTALDNQQ